MLHYIGKFAKEMGLINTLNHLTGIEMKQLLSMENNLKDNY